jgi:hypothetical protein
MPRKTCQSRNPAIPNTCKSCQLSYPIQGDITTMSHKSGVEFVSTGTVSAHITSCFKTVNSPPIPFHPSKTIELSRQGTYLARTRGSSDIRIGSFRSTGPVILMVSSPHTPSLFPRNTLPVRTPNWLLHHYTRHLYHQGSMQQHEVSFTITM